MAINEEDKELNYVKLAYESNQFDDQRLRDSIKYLLKKRNLAFFDILKSSLYGSNYFWKLIAVDKILYYKDKLDKSDIGQIQVIFESENDIEIKISAANLLGFSDKESEGFLYRAYKKESNIFVKAAIIASIFVINNIPPFLGLPFSDRISSGEINPSEVEIKNFMQGTLKQKDQ